LFGEESRRRRNNLNWSSYRFYLLDEAGLVRMNSGWAEISFGDYMG